MQQLLFRIDDAAHILGVGRSTLYNLINAGELDTVRIGKRRSGLLTSASRTADKAERDYMDGPA